MTVAVIEQPESPAPVVHTEAIAPVTALLHAALDKGVAVDQLNKLVDLHERMEARQSARDFALAMANFQRDCPPIKKSSDASIATKSGGKYTYTFAELDEIARTVNPILSRNGLSYTWDAEVKGANLECVCTVRHINGHSVESKISVPTSTASAMSDQQKIGAALTFAKRLSLSSALGITTTDEDTDGGDGKGAVISPAQVAQIEALLAVKSVGRNADALLKRTQNYFKIPNIAFLQEGDFQRCITMLNEIETKPAPESK